MQKCYLPELNIALQCVQAQSCVGLSSLPHSTWQPTEPQKSHKIICHFLLTKRERERGIYQPSWSSGWSQTTTKMTSMKLIHSAYLQQNTNCICCGNDTKCSNYHSSLRVYRVWSFLLTSNDICRSWSLIYRCRLLYIENPNSIRYVKISLLEITWIHARFPIRVCKNVRTYIIRFITNIMLV